MSSTRRSACLREAVALRSSNSGAGHYMVGYSMVNLATVLLDQGKAAEAQRETLAALKIYDKTLPRSHMYVATALRTLGLSLIDQGKAAQAEAPLREALEIQQQRVGANSPQVTLTRAALGGALLERRSYAEAESLLLSSYPDVLASQGQDDSMTVRVRTWVEQLFTQTGRPDAIAPYFARAAIPRERANRQP